MSIIKTRELLEKRGCGTCIGVVIGIVFLLGIVMTGQRQGCGNSQMGPNGQMEKFAVARVGDIDIDLAAFDGLVKVQFGQNEGMFASLPVDTQTKLNAGVLADMIRRARLVAVGKKMGIEISDEALASKIDSEVEDMLKSQYSMYVKQQPKGKEISYDEFRKTPGALNYKEQVRSYVAPFEAGDNVYYTKAKFVEQEMTKKLAGGKDLKSLKPDELKKVFEQIDAKTKEGEKEYPITWNDPGFKLLYEIETVAKNYAAIKALIDETKKLSEDSSKVRDTTLLRKVAYTLVVEAWKVATPEQKKELLDAKISSIEDVLTTTEDFNLRMELVDLYKEAGNADKAIEHLTAASDNNVKYDSQGKGYYDAINKKLKELVDSKFIDATAAKMVSDMQKKWLDGKADQDKFEKEAKEMEAQREKERAEEAKKFEAEKKKFQEEEAKKKAGASESKPATK